MSALDQIAICKYISRSYSPPRLAALVPQLEVINDDVQEKPPGFHLILLPFADDLREVEWTETAEPTDEQVEKCLSIISKIFVSRGYSYDQFENPSKCSWDSLERQF